MKFSPIILLILQTRLLYSQSIRDIYYLAGEKVSLEFDLYSWSNPDARTYSGTSCDAGYYDCDTVFKVHLETSPVTDSSKYFQWPGDTPTYLWSQVGSDSYQGSRVLSIGRYVENGLPVENLNNAIFRVLIEHHGDPKNPILINMYNCRLPVGQDLKIAESAEKAIFSRGEYLDCVAMTPIVHPFKQWADMNVINSHRLRVQARVWIEPRYSINYWPEQYPSTRAVQIITTPSPRNRGVFKSSSQYERPVFDPSSHTSFAQYEPRRWNRR